MKILPPPPPKNNSLKNGVTSDSPLPNLATRKYEVWASYLTSFSPRAVVTTTVWKLGCWNRKQKREPEELNQSQTVGTSMLLVYPSFASAAPTLTIWFSLVYRLNRTFHIPPDILPLYIPGFWHLSLLGTCDPLSPCREGKPSISLDA